MEEVKKENIKMRREEVRMEYWRKLNRRKRNTKIELGIEKVIQKK
jgi:hypothetical protein